MTRPRLATVAEYPTGTFGATHPDRDEGPARLRHRRLSYAIGAAVLAAIVMSAAADGVSDIDIWGVSTGWVAASGGGYELDVRYPTVTRPALATPFAIVVHREAGFAGPVDIAVDADWLEMWDYQSLYPMPAESTANRQRFFFSFRPPKGEVLRIFFDARIQPSQQSGGDGWVAVLDGAGRTAAKVSFSTVVLP